MHLQPTDEDPELKCCAWCGMWFKKLCHHCREKAWKRTQFKSGFFKKIQQASEDSKKS